MKIINYIAIIVEHKTDDVETVFRKKKRIDHHKL